MVTPSLWSQRLLCSILLCFLLLTQLARTLCVDLCLPYSLLPSLVLQQALWFHAFGVMLAVFCVR